MLGMLPSSDIFRTGDRCSAADPMRGFPSPLIFLRKTIHDIRAQRQFALAPPREGLISALNLCATGHGQAHNR